MKPLPDFVPQEMPTDPRFTDITGKRFGQLTVQKYLGKDAHSQRVQMWLCICDCGQETIVRRCNLGNGHTTRCPKCPLRVGEQIHNYIDGRGSHPLYQLWAKVIERCEKTSNIKYSRYGGRGIVVCKRWHDFQDFVQDVSPRPTGLEIDRIDNDGGYWCGHCEECIELNHPQNWRWATRKQQMNNQSRNQRFTVNGKEQTIAEWRDETGIPYKTLQNRFHKGWGEDRILSPSRPKRKKALPNAVNEVP